MERERERWNRGMGRRRKVQRISNSNRRSVHGFCRGLRNFDLTVKRFGSFFPPPSVAHCRHRFSSTISSLFPNYSFSQKTSAYVCASYFSSLSPVPLPMFIRSFPAPPHSSFLPFSTRFFHPCPLCSGEQEMIEIMKIALFFVVDEKLRHRIRFYLEFYILILEIPRWNAQWIFTHPHQPLISEWCSMIQSATRYRDLLIGIWKIQAILNSLNL